jgi:hypothetical protein
MARTHGSQGDVTDNEQSFFHATGMNVNKDASYTDIEEKRRYLSQLNFFTLGACISVESNLKTIFLIYLVSARQKFTDLLFYSILLH